MKKQFSAAIVLLVAGLAAGAVQAQVHAVRASDLEAAEATANLPLRAGEASTMTNGVPNVLTSNVQPGELGIQSRLTVRQRAPAYAGDPSLKMMGAPGLIRPVLIAPPAP